MRRLIQTTFLLFACIQFACGPYALFQGYAWVGMLIQYSQEDGIVKAAKDAFSGSKPCALCCRIAAAKQEGREKPSEVPVSMTSLSKLLQEFVPGREIELISLVGWDVPAVVFGRVVTSAGEENGRPAVPPPRILA